MQFPKQHFFCACVVGLVLITPAHNAPRSRSKGQSSIKFDQQQTGDYNIQLHLKDFHIVAMLGDGGFGSYGDYDYNYDYTDLTIKPIIPITTANPQDSSSSSEAPSTESEEPEVETLKPNDHPYPIIAPSSSLAPEQPSSTTTEAQSSTTASPAANVTTTAQQQVTHENMEKTTKESFPSTTKNPESQATKGPKKEPAVSIISENEAAEEDKKKAEPSLTNISILPAENSGVTSSSERLPLGEIMHYRKCADGYARDKQGRCRKIRRTPHIPFGITRFASNLASRFRQATVGGSSP